LIADKHANIIIFVFRRRGGCNENARQNADFQWRLSLEIALVPRRRKTKNENNVRSTL